MLELWGAEYQESNALLVRTEHRQILQGICDREKVPVSFVGVITGEQIEKCVILRRRFWFFGLRRNK